MLIKDFLKRLHYAKNSNYSIRKHEYESEYTKTQYQTLLEEYGDKEVVYWSTDRFNEVRIVYKE